MVKQWIVAKTNFVEAARKYGTSMFVETSDSAPVERIISDMSLTPPRVAIGAGEEVVNHNLAQALEEIKVPVRCICSNSNPFRP
jgi:hypothetical protein